MIFNSTPTPAHSDHINLKTPSLNRILHLFPTINDTFLVLCKRSQKQYAIMHISSKGHELYRHSFDYEEYKDCSILRMGMVKENVAVLIVPRKDQVLFFGVWDPEKDQDGLKYSQNKLNSGQEKEGQRKQLSSSKKEESKGIPYVQATIQLQPPKHNNKSPQKTYHYRLGYYQHNFISDYCQAHTLYFFPVTKLFCVVQKGHNLDNRLKLTYYKYPEQQQLKKLPLLQPYKFKKELPIIQLQKVACQQFSTKNDWNSDCTVCQGNMESMVLWYKNVQDKKFEFSFYHRAREVENEEEENEKEKEKGYRQDMGYKTEAQDSSDIVQQWVHKKVSIPHQITHINPSNPKTVQVCIRSAFEFTPGVIIAFCHTDRARFKNVQQLLLVSPSRQRISFKQDQAYNNLHYAQLINNNFLIDTRNKTVRETKFTFGPYQPYQIEQINLGNITVVKTFMYSHGETFISPVFYIHNQSEKIVFVQPWYCLSNIKWQLPGYEIDKIQQCVYSNGGEIRGFSKVVSKSVHDPKDVYMHLLLGMYEDWDEDLLYETLEVIDFDVYWELKFDA